MFAITVYKNRWVISIAGVAPKGEMEPQMDMLWRAVLEIVPPPQRILFEARRLKRPRTARALMTTLPRRQRTARLQGLAEVLSASGLPFLKDDECDAPKDYRSAPPSAFSEDPAAFIRALKPSTGLTPS